MIAKNFPNMGKEPLTQIQKAQRVPYKTNPRRNTLRHILIKLTKMKDKEKILKAAREKKQITYKGKILQPRLLYPERLSFRFEGEIKSFTDKKKAKRIQQH